MAKRTLTLLVEFENDQRPPWIWESLKERATLHGVRVKVICEGDQICKCEDDEYECPPPIRSHEATIKVKNNE